MAFGIRMIRLLISHHHFFPRPGDCPQQMLSTRFINSSWTSGCHHRAGTSPAWCQRYLQSPMDESKLVARPKLQSGGKPGAMIDQSCLGRWLKGFTEVKHVSLPGLLHGIHGIPGPQPWQPNPAAHLGWACGTPFGAHFHQFHCFKNASVKRPLWR